MIIVDTREKPKAITKILEYFDKYDYKYMTSKLLIGDYMEYNNPSLVIDRKQNVAELAKNCTTDHDRFKREMERAKSSPHTQVTGEKIYRVLASWTAKYPISVKFCDKRTTGRNICEILYNTKLKP